MYFEKFIWNLKAFDISISFKRADQNKKDPHTNEQDGSGQLEFERPAEFTTGYLRVPPDK